MRVLVVTAVAAERAAVARGLLSATGGTAVVPGYDLLRLGLPVPDPTATDNPSDWRPALADLLVAGVGPAAAAAGAAAALVAALAGQPYDLVISAGIAGGFPEVAPVGTVVIADSIVAADLGAEAPGHPSGFLQVTELGFGRSEHRPPAELSAAAARAASAVHAPVLTVSTVTGSAERAAALADRHPGAAAEAMEGFGVAEAAAAHQVPVLEIRGISNPVGPRDRDSWQVGPALSGLADAFRTVAPVLGAWKGPVL